MALTGTATPAAQADIRQTLGMRNDALVHAASHDRPNLTYAVRIKTSSMARHLTAALVGHESCIVYCSARADAEKASATLRADGVAAVDFYHARQTIEQRRDVYERFMSGELTCVCATVAFGS
jgi:superfamily II DNA helicase RecQ